MKVIAAVAEAPPFDLMIVLEGSKLPLRGQVQRNWNLKGVSVCGNCRRRESGLLSEYCVEWECKPQHQETMGTTFEAEDFGHQALSLSYTWWGIM
jgi:hypothetical protein